MDATIMRGAARPGAGRKAGGKNKAPSGHPDQRQWAIQLLASAFQQDAKGLVAAAKLVVAYVETSE